MKQRVYSFADTIQLPLYGKAGRQVQQHHPAIITKRKGAHTMAVTNVHPEVQKDLINHTTTDGELRQKIFQAIMDLRDGKINVEQAKKINSEFKKHNAALRRKLAETRRELAKRDVVKQTESK